jgi:hypothetical protein
VAGHTREYGEVMKIARSYAPAAMHRLAELAELNQIDSEGNLVSLSDLPHADRRVIAVAANALLDRALGKPKPVTEEPKDDMAARLARMSREERLAEMMRLLEPMQRYLPPGEEVERTVPVGGSPGPSHRDGQIRDSQVRVTISNPAPSSLPGPAAVPMRVPTFSTAATKQAVASITTPSRPRMTASVPLTVCPRQRLLRQKSCRVAIPARAELPLEATRAL